MALAISMRSGPRGPASDGPLEPDSIVMDTRFGVVDPLWDPLHGSALLGRASMDSGAGALSSGSGAGGMAGLRTTSTGGMRGPAVVA